MDAKALRRRLEKIAHATASSQSVDATGFWVGDRAGERQATDDFSTGRRAWLGAYDAACAGLKALDGDDLDLAEIYVWQANDFLMDALWSRIEPSDVEFLSSSAQRRGRKPKTQGRNAKLAAAIQDQHSIGITGKAARNAALKKYPDLAKAFSGMSDDAIRKAADRGAKDLN
ncbi:hypothetical protein TW83_01660 [Paracoccus sp. S4493]|uniref:hypothetical protein n=1 Tax=Paracoccus sp. S4493 TaxID=579490 RepID=UPI0005F9AE37|nr:hypothetical protein [Paracoccus sp. S4493]KJZ32743.1 hypothetical protein TW83_01660 [Paracoccus sp. S4493]